MIERYGVRSKLNAGAGEGGGGGEPACVCNNHIHDATSVALGGFTKYIHTCGYRIRCTLECVGIPQ